MVQCGILLIAARGSTIDLFQDGSLHSTWRCPPIQGAGNSHPLPEATTKLAAQNLESPLVEINIDSVSPPTKKRKLSASGPADAQTLSKDGKKKKNRSDAVLSGLEAPAVVALAITGASNHVVAVTAEDKSIRVFEIVQESGIHRLKQLSQR
jgi:tRNA (guanine-N(7)-)-methyltransferase subunit TRM82